MSDDFAYAVYIDLMAESLQNWLFDRYTVIVEKEEEREGLWLLHGSIEHRAHSNSGDVQGEHQ